MPRNIQTMTRNVQQSALALIIAIGMLTACGGDDNPVAPAPEPPAPTPTPTPTPPPSARPCTIGLELGPGQSCSYSGGTFEVRDDGFGCAFGGSICSGAGITLNNFSAKKISNNPVRWRIESLP